MLQYRRRLRCFYGRLWYQETPFPTSDHHRFTTPLKEWLLVFLVIMVPRVSFGISRSFMTMFPPIRSLFGVCATRNICYRPQQHSLLALEIHRSNVLFKLSMSHDWFDWTTDTHGSAIQNLIQIEKEEEGKYLSLISHGRVSIGRNRWLSKTFWSVAETNRWGRSSQEKTAENLFLCNCAMKTRGIRKANEVPLILFDTKEWPVQVHTIDTTMKHLVWLFRISS